MLISVLFTSSTQKLSISFPIVFHFSFSHSVKKKHCHAFHSSTAASCLFRVIIAWPFLLHLNTNYLRKHSFYNNKKKFRLFLVAIGSKTKENVCIFVSVYVFYMCASATSQPKDEWLLPIVTWNKWIVKEYSSSLSYDHWLPCQEMLFSVH